MIIFEISAAPVDRTVRSLNYNTAADRCNRIFLHPAADYWLVCRSPQTNVQSPQLDFRAGLDHSLYNDECFALAYHSQTERRPAGDASQTSVCCSAYYKPWMVTPFLWVASVRLVFDRDFCSAWP